MNYKNRYPWMTAKLRYQIIEKNKLQHACSIPQKP